MIRLLIDTNVLVAAGYNPSCASRKIVSGVEAGAFKLIVSPAILREYELILPKAIRSEAARARIQEAIQDAESVTPAEVPYVTEDRTDDKFLAAAVIGHAEAIITNDEHLLAVHPYQGIEIVRPVAFWDRLPPRGHEASGR